MIAGGVPAGARMPCQAIASKPGYPLSAMVGRSGATGERSLLVTASAVSVPARTCASAETGSANTTCTCPADQVGDRKRRPAIGDMRHLDARLAIEQLGQEMIGGANACRAVVELAGLALGERDKLGHRLHAERGIDHEDVGIGGGHADRREILFGIVGQLWIDARIDRDRSGLAEQQGVAVGVGIAARFRCR